MGNVCDAFKLYELSSNNISSINVMMNVYCDNQMNIQCMEMFNYMRQNKIKPDYICIKTILRAAFHESSLDFAEEMNEYLKNELNDKDYNYIMSNLHVQLHWIWLYGKCNKLIVCENIFQSICVNEPATSSAKLLIESPPLKAD